MKRDKYYGLSPRIAVWKIDNIIENWLSYKADHSEIWKSIYVSYYRFADRKYYWGGVKFIDKCISEYPYLHDTSRSYLIKDMVYCLHRFGISFEEYCIYHFIDKTFRCRNSFVSDKLRHYYADILNSDYITPLLNDKYQCYEAYKNFYGREVIACYSPEDKDLFVTFARKHKTFVLKPVSDNCGHGVQFTTLEENEILAFFNDRIRRGPFVAEEPIDQGVELKVLHPESINTLRVSTFVLGDEVLINAIVLRIGSGSSVVDNAGSGGMYASVDIENGIIQSNARDYKGREYNFHPDTKVQIIGHKLPEWDSLLDTVKSIAKHKEGSNLIAWDLAYSTKGWIMVEGNAVGSWDVLQSNLQRGLKPMLISRIDNFFNLNKGSLPKI